MKVNTTYLSVLFYTFKYTGQEEHECTNKFMKLSLIKYRAKVLTTSAKPSACFLDNELRLLLEYQFLCPSTNITSLLLGIDVRAGDNYTKFPTVSVFRPDGDESLPVPNSERVIYYSPSNVSISGVFEYPLNPPIPVISGDLLAVSQPKQWHSAVRVYYIKNIQFKSISYKKDGRNVADQLVLVYPVTGMMKHNVHH